MGKKDKAGKVSKKHRSGVYALKPSAVPIGFTSTMPGTLTTPQPGGVPVPLASSVPPLSAVPTTGVAPASGMAPTSGMAPASGGSSSSLGAPSPEQALASETQRRMMDLAVEKETLSVRLEDATRQRAALETKVAELTAALADLRTQSTGSDQQLTSLVAERDKLLAENQRLNDDILNLPAELEAVTKSRAFKIMKAAPILAIRKPLSTLLIVGAMGALANLWDFSNLARTIYLVVGGIVLLVSAIQFLARND